MKTPQTEKISIITISLNSDKFIENAIKSVLRQTYENIEYIIIDGKSTDRTIEIINRYRNKISLIISEQDQGIYDAMNKGIRLATGDVIYFLNADDCLHDEYVLHDVMSKFNEDKALSLLFGNVIYVDNQTREKDLRKFEHINCKNLIHDNLCHQGVFAKKNLFYEIGFFDTKFSIAADYDWLLKVFMCRSYKTMYLNRVIAFFNSSGIHMRYEQLAMKERKAVILKNSREIYYNITHFFYRVKRKIKRSINEGFQKNKITT